jgi:translation elongation factor EF-Ts
LKPLPPLLSLDGKSVGDTVKDAIAHIGENMNLRRSAKLSVDDGVVATYVHNAVADGLGKLGVIVAVKSTGNKDALNAFGRQIAMHIAATNRCALTSDDVDADRCRARAQRLHPNRRVNPASRKTSSRRWSKAACASSTRK